MKQQSFEFATVAVIGGRRVDRKQLNAFRKRVDERAAQLTRVSNPPKEAKQELVEINKRQGDNQLSIPFE